MNSPLTMAFRSISSSPTNPALINNICKWLIFLLYFLFREDGNQNYEGDNGFEPGLSINEVIDHQYEYYYPNGEVDPDSLVLFIRKISDNEKLWVPIQVFLD